MKLAIKKNGKGYITSYSLNIGSAEARKAGFIDENGSPLELKKIIDEDSKTITISLASEKS